MVMQHENDEWKEKLTPEQYKVMREKGTEAPFSGKYVTKAGDGMYHCAGCGTALFSSDAQFESKEPGLQGWPSFEKAENVEFKEDTSGGMKRTEVVCKTCGAHLGHIFDASDSPSGKHYCINSCALDFKGDAKKG